MDTTLVHQQPQQTVANSMMNSFDKRNVFYGNFRNRHNYWHYNSFQGENYWLLTQLVYHDHDIIITTNKFSQI